MSVGRPPMYDNPEELQASIDKYFAEASEGKYTITGLVLFIGFADRKSFYDHEKKSEFAHIIKTARTRIENDYEQTLRSQYSTGSIFALKNFGWTDKTESDINVKGGLTVILEDADSQDKEDKDL